MASSNNITNTNQSSSSEDETFKSESEKHLTIINSEESVKEKSENISEDHESTFIKTDLDHNSTNPFNINPDLIVHPEENSEFTNGNLNSFLKHEIMCSINV